MATRPESRISVGEFPGLVNNEDPKDIPNGAAIVQVNFAVRIEGLLTVRRGFRIAAFDSVRTIDSLAADA
jgi:hypothetical protein